MFKRFVSFLVSFSMLLIAGVLGVGGVLAYRSMVATEDVEKFSFKRERPIEVEAAPLVRQSVTPTVNTFGTVEAGEQSALSFELAGVISELSSVALSGGNIRRGEVIARLRLDDVKDSARSSALSVEEAAVRLEQLSADQSKLQDEVASAERQLDLAQTQFEARQRLVARGFLAKNALNGDEQAVLNAETALEAKRALLADIDNQRRLAELSKERAEIDATAAKDDLGAVELVAPAFGFLGRSAVSVGQTVNANTIIASFTPSTAVNVSFRLPFTDYGRLLASEAVGGNPEKIIGQPVDATWRLGAQSYSYKGKVAAIDRTAVSDAASVRVSARLERIRFSDPLPLGAQLEVSLAEQALKGVFLVSERALNTDGELFAIKNGQLAATKVTQLGFVNEAVVVRADFTGAEGYVPTRTKQMYNGAKVRVTNRDGLNDPIPASDAPAVEGADQVASAAPATTGGNTRARNADPAARGQGGGQRGQGGGQGGGQGRRPAWADDPDVEMVKLSPGQQKAITKGIKSSPMPDSVKKRIIAQVEKGEVPAPMLERMSRFLR